MSDAFIEVYDHLVRERGGSEALSVVDKALCRQVAHVLVSDVGNASAVASLTALLPPVLPRKPEIAPVEGATPPNLELLDDAQLHALDSLVSIACGLAPPEPLPVPTWRHEEAAALADVLDTAFGSAVPANVEAGGKVEIDEAALERIRTLAYRLLYPMQAGQLYGFAEIEARANVAERRAVDAEARAANFEQRALRAEHQVAGAARGNRADNVVPLRAPQPELAPGLNGGGAVRTPHFGDQLHGDG